MAPMKYLLFTALLTASLAEGAAKYTVSLKPAMAGEKLAVTPALAEGELEPAISSAVVRLLSDKKFLPSSKEGITASTGDDSLTFGFPFSFQKKASERFRSCIVQWFEALPTTDSLGFGAYVYATIDSSESEWKAYGTQMAEDFLRATSNGGADCTDKAPSRDDTQGLLIQVDSYLVKSGAQPKDIKARMSWFGDRVIAAMLGDITQKRNAELLTYVRQWIENIRTLGLEPTRTLDFKELWAGKNLSRPELAGRALFRLLPKEKIDAAATSKDVTGIYGALVSVDNLLTACSSADGSTSSSSCVDNEKVFWLDLKTANGNVQYILRK